MDRRYVIYGGGVSLFTRKLEAALRFYGAPHHVAPPPPEASSRSATHQVPVLHTPENWMIADTTPQLALLDGRYPARRLFPPGPLGVLVHVVEEILDEWFARTMVHFRWHYDENTLHVVRSLTGKEVTLEEAREFPLAKWGLRSCRATGTESPHQQREAEREHFELLDALEAQLGSTRYALGNRPTAVDAILLGGLRAHTNAEPIPDLSTYPRIRAWDRSDADAWDGGGELAPFPTSTPFAAHVLGIARDVYAPFLIGTERALHAGEKAFVIETYGEDVSYLARPYPLQSRDMIRDRIANQLEDAERGAVARWLDTWRVSSCFLPARGQAP